QRRNRASTPVLVVAHMIPEEVRRKVTPGNTEVGAGLELNRRENAVKARRIQHRKGWGITKVLVKGGEVGSARTNPGTHSTAKIKTIIDGRVVAFNRQIEPVTRILIDQVVNVWWNGTADSRTIGHVRKFKNLLLCTTRGTNRQQRRTRGSNRRR